MSVCILDESCNHNNAITEATTPWSTIQKNQKHTIIIILLKYKMHFTHQDFWLFVHKIHTPLFKSITLLYRLSIHVYAESPVCAVVLMTQILIVEQWTQRASFSMRFARFENLCSLNM